MKWLRRALLEQWAVLMFAAILGFLGPFGTYGDGDFLSRCWRWWTMLLGAYVIVRPAIRMWRWMARSTGLPRGPTVFWGVVFTGLVVTGLWAMTAPVATRLVGGYSGLVPFAMLCSLGIMLVVGWAERADAQLLNYYQDTVGQRGRSDFSGGSRPAGRQPALPPTNGPRLRARLSPAFNDDILAIESEDHYVRVYGHRQNELILLRLRDAIAEMDHVPGAQTHRSWWVARHAVASVRQSGRNRELILINGSRAPIARDSVERLQSAGFLPG